MIKRAKKKKIRYNVKEKGGAYEKKDFIGSITYDDYEWLLK